MTFAGTSCKSPRAGHQEPPCCALIQRPRPADRVIVEARWSFFSSRYLFSVEAFLWPLKDSQTRGNPSAAASAVGRLWVGPVGPGGGYPRRLRSCSAGSLLGQSWLCASHGAAPWTNPAQPAFPRLARGAARLHPPFPGLGRASSSPGCGPDQASLRLASRWLWPWPPPGQPE